MGKHFNIEIRKTCKICGNPLPKRCRTYCSKKCRRKAEYKKFYSYQLEYGRKKRGEYSPDKKRCKICGRWYVQVGSHIVQVHHITARKYRELYDLPVKKGITPDWYKELKAKYAIENGTWKNLQIGKKYQYKKGDPRAAKNIFWKGRKYKRDEYY